MGGTPFFYMGRITPAKIKVYAAKMKVYAANVKVYAAELKDGR